MIRNSTPRFTANRNAATRLAAVLAVALSLSPVLTGSAAAMGISFGDGWKTQRLSLFSHNRFDFSGNALEIASDDAVSLVYRRLPAADWAAGGASWNWSVSQSVPVTDLSRKGGDDRNIALYFVFLPEDQAKSLAPDTRASALLQNEQARVLVYVWGGAGPKGAFLKSPYLKERGATVVRRPAGTGSFSEAVDLSADFKRAFGVDRTSLVGVAISADSDDTDSTVRARVQDLALN